LRQNQGRQHLEENDHAWQVTGIRDDPYARAHPIEIESDKPDAQRGRYQFADWPRYADDAAQ